MKKKKLTKLFLKTSPQITYDIKLFSLKQEALGRSYDIFIRLYLR